MKKKRVWIKEQYRYSYNSTLPRSPYLETRYKARQASLNIKSHLQSVGILQERGQLCLETLQI